jgi:hypothetical protein
MSNWRFNDDDRREEAYARGATDAGNAGVIEELFHVIGDAVTTVLPSTASGSHTKRDITRGNSARPQ